MKRIGLLAIMLVLFFGHLAYCASPASAENSEWTLDSSVEGPGIKENLAPADEKTLKVQWKGRTFAFDGVMKASDGALYLSLESLGHFFATAGAMCTWSGNKDILFIHSSGRDIFFSPSASRMKARARSLDSARGMILCNGAAYLPINELFSFMGFSQKQSTPAMVVLSTRLDDIYVKDDDGARRLMLHTSAPVAYRVMEEDMEHAVLFFPDTVWDIDEKSLDAGDFSVSHEAGDQGVTLTLRYPRNWDGRLMGSSTSGTMPVELLPHFPLMAGYRAETIDNVQAHDRGITLSASGPFHYFWSYSPDRKTLTIDIPLAVKGQDIMIPRCGGDLVREWSLNSFVSGYGATRATFVLQEGVAFSFPQGGEGRNAFSVAFSRGSAASVQEGHGFTAPPEVCGTIVIDPGHGGCDPGACNNAMGLREKDLTLDMAARLASELRSMGWKVVMTRTTDRDVSWAHSPDRVELQSRADVANVNGADAFISIHCNASVSSALSGSSIHWCKEIDYSLAKSFQGLLGASLGITERGLCRDRFYVLSHTKMPAVLVETAFISNPADALKLSDRAFRERIARAVARGLDGFMEGRYARSKKPIITSTDRQAGISPVPAQGR